MARIGIDLGTTNTVVALVYDDGPHVVPRGRGRIIPSVVHFRGEDGDADIVTGEEADRFESGTRVVRSVKRLMGRTHDEALSEGSAKFFPPDAGSVRLVRRGRADLGLHLVGADGRVVWPHEVSAHVLREAKRHAEAVLQTTVDTAVVTVPAYFGGPHRQATLDAARLAGLEVFGDLLDEPSAAALAFAPVVGFEPGEPVLVVDWGGGTFDVTVQACNETEWLQAAIDGDRVLGGDDLDRALLELVLRRSKVPAAVVEDDANRWLLLKAARAAKERLSDDAEAHLTCRKLTDPETGKKLPPVALQISRGDFEAEIAPLLDRVAEITERCLAQPDVDRDGIRKALLVGGSSRIPAFRRRIAAILPKARLCDDVDPMLSVALGAAIYASAVPRILRMCPYGYAVQGDDGMPEEVIPPRTDIPTPDYGRFGVPATTRYAGQTVYRLTLVPFTRHGRKAHFHRPQRLFARGMPPTAAGTRVDVEIWLDGHKIPRGACHVEGRAEALPLEGREEGDDALFTNLNDATLDAEAKIEANRRGEGGLVEALVSAADWARNAEAQRDRSQAERSLERLQDLLEQIEARRRSQLEEGTPDEVARRRVQEWVPVFETELLAAFWEHIPPRQRDEAIARLRALRVMLQTAAPARDLYRGLEGAKQTLFEGEIGPVLKALYYSWLIGVPGRLAERLREDVERVREALRADDREGFDRARTDLEKTLAETEALLKRYWATEALVDAAPDLVVLRQAGTRGD